MGKRNTFEVPFSDAFIISQSRYKMGRGTSLAGLARLREVVARTCSRGQDENGGWQERALAAAGR